jgi:hypothetical protein
MCEKRKLENKFYSAGRLKAGFFHICKTCLQIKTKNNDIDYVVNVLKEMDRPMIRSYWNKIYYRFGDTCFGNYLKYLLLDVKYKDLCFEDSILDETIKENEMDEVEFNDKWRGSFTIPDLQYLEKYYEDLHRDYRITTTNHKDYAKKIAKTSLAMDKAYERLLNDRDDKKASTEFKELKGIFDDLCKSAQFSESTRSANDVGLGSFGVIFNLVESNEWIPQHKPLKKDTYDKLLDQFSNIEKSL